mmetsp:Transcript_20055/g.14763  ORF Transcript_20055/g.14763 Transcript_20055/m.14763 type:complete len:99 (+) Transcript_20055:1042-1338(+)
MEENQSIVKSLFGVAGEKKKSKREELIDRKIEGLLETYKRMDEELVRKARDKDLHGNMRRKVLREKFGFSDDEEEDEEEEEENSYVHAKKGKVQVNST